MRRVILGLVIVVVLLFPLFTSSVFAQCVHGYCPCKGNFDCDDDIDGSDAAIFKSFFGCSPFGPCCRPNCQAPLSKTGQTTSYAIGDDGDLEIGIEWEEPRFYDNSDGTVIDALTGLAWLKDANCAYTIGHDPDGMGNGSMTWQHALDFIAGINDGTYPLCGAGYTDWRLPNSNELASLVHRGYYNPAVPNTAGTGKWTEGDPFNNVEFYYYWSSTTYASILSYAWGVSMGYGHVYVGTKSGYDYVWPVRGGH